MNAFQRLWRASPTPACYVFAAVLLLRLVTLFRFIGSPAFLPTSGDAQFYDEWAQRIAAGQWTDGHAFYGLPLYAYMLAAVYKLFGHAPFLIGLLQACADAFVASLLFKIATKLYDAPAPEARAIGIIAAAGWAFFMPAAAYSLILMPTTWGVLASWFVVWKVVEQDLSPSVAAAVSYGVLIGFVAMATATILFFAVLVLAAIAFKPTRVARWPASASKLIATVAVIGGIALGSGPAWMHNIFIAHDRVFLSAHGGVNFWIGNNGEATGYPHFPEGLRANQAEMLADSIKIAESAAGHPLLRSEVSHFWSGKAWHYIRTEPLSWVRLLAKKLRNSVSAFEYDDLGVIARFREERLVLPGLTFGIVAALALPGLCISLARFRRARWIIAAVALQLAALLPVFVTERYRLAAAPGLVLFASATLVFLWRYCVQRRFAPAAGCILFAASGAIAVSARPAETSVWALQFYNAGMRAAERGESNAAERNFRLALEYAPDNPEVTFALANLEYARREVAAAERLYQQVLAVAPRHSGALNNLGLLELDQERPALAERCFRSALERDAANAKTHYLLARALEARGDYDAARDEAGRAVELSPAQPAFRALRDQLNGR